jgi:hypothetical protein
MLLRDRSIARAGAGAVRTGVAVIGWREEGGEVFAAFQDRAAGAG